jgi:hypothetical protein
VALGVILAHCSPPTNCLRYSDCGDGLTCAGGKCVPPPVSPSDAGDDGALLTTPDTGTSSTVTDSAIASSGSDGAPDAADDAAASDDAASDATGE